MTIHYQGHGVTLHHGDCLDVLRTLPDASVDSVVTDPPYGLEFMGKSWDGSDGFRRSLNAADAGRENAFGRASRTSPEYRAGHLFGEWCELWAAECLRVLKPGGYLLAFGGTRTWHRLACAVEDAGFEVRDSIAWMYGSGFPKSLDVSKAIDKRRTEDAEPVRAICRAIRAAMDVRDLRSRHLVEHFDGCHPRLIDHWAARDTDSQPALPTWEQWERLRDLFAELAEYDAEAWRLNGRKGTPGEAWEGAEVIGTARGIDTATSRLGFVGATYGGTSAARDYDVKAPASPESQSWQGWGTALKPAFEPVVVARKPLTGTVASNVLAHGTGALNIDGCRIEHANEADLATSLSKNPGRSDAVTSGVYGADRPQQRVNTSGRWPANVVLDEEMARRLDEQSGEAGGGTGRSTRGGGNGGDWNPTDRTEDAGQTVRGDGREVGYGDMGGASRFFFVASHDKGDTSALTGKGGRIESCETASTAAESSSPPRQFGDSALGGAVTSEHPDTASQTGSPSTSATPSGSRPSGRPATPTTQNIDAESSPEQQPGERTPTASPASSVGPSAPTVTTTTTTSPSTSAGSAAPATSDTTSQWKALGDTDSAPFKYVAKADATERPRVNGTAHPTVKPLDLMRWLVRLVTPPGGTVLEPFAGSGTTVEACIIEGFQCIAIEREADYLPLIRQRIDRRRDPVEALRGQAADLGLFDLLGGEGA